MADYGVGSWPARRARINPAHAALRQGDRSVTYAELAERVDRLAAALAARGVGHGDRVGYLGPNDVAQFEVLFATLRLGAIFAPYNWRLAAPEIEYLVADSAPAVLVHAAQFEVAQLPVPAIEVGKQLEALIADGGEFVGGNVGLDDGAVILYTSGTTGRPKGAVLSHGNITFNTMNQLAHADVLSSDTALCISPLFHATGLGQVSLPTLFKGGTVIVIAKFEPELVLRTVAEQRIASFSAVPTMLQMLADHPDFAGTDLSSLRYVIYGGSTVLERVARAWQARGVEILQGYGMTEASPGVTLAIPEGSRGRPVSIGVPHFFSDVRIDASGELLVRGLNVFHGYWNRAEDALEEGWYRSGDIVRVDEDGWAYVVDRVKDMIISGGENIYPSEVELAINSLDGVLESAVVAVPDERWGEVGAAYVLVDEPGRWSEEELLDAVRGKLAAFKIPKSVQFVTDLPRTATGKVQRARLRNAPPSSLKPGT